MSILPCHAYLAAASLPRLLALVCLCGLVRGERSYHGYRVLRTANLEDTLARMVSIMSSLIPSALLFINLVVFVLIMMAMLIWPGAH